MQILMEQGNGTKLIKYRRCKEEGRGKMSGRKGNKESTQIEEGRREDQVLRYKEKGK